MRTEIDVLRDAIETGIGFKVERGATIDGADCAVRVLAQRAGVVVFESTCDAFGVDGSLIVSVGDERDGEDIDVRVRIEAAVMQRRPDGSYHVKGRASFIVDRGGE